MPERPRSRVCTTDLCQVHPNVPDLCRDQSRRQYPNSTRIRPTAVTSACLFFLLPERNRVRRPTLYFYVFSTFQDEEIGLPFPSIYLSICLFARLSVCPSVCLSVCLPLRIFIRQIISESSYQILYIM